MSYYDYDDHFWSPREVCCQSPQQIQKKNFLKRWIVIAIPVIVLFSISIVFLLKQNDNNKENDFNYSALEKIVILSRIKN
jgi:hypothetical protein